MDTIVLSTNSVIGALSTNIVVGALSTNIVAIVLSIHVVAVVLPIHVVAVVFPADIVAILLFAGVVAAVHGVLSVGDIQRLLFLQLLYFFKPSYVMGKIVCCFARVVNIANYIAWLRPPCSCLGWFAEFDGFIGVV